MDRLETREKEAFDKELINLYSSMDRLETFKSILVVPEEPEFIFQYG